MPPRIPLLPQGPPAGTGRGPRGALRASCAVFSVPPHLPPVPFRTAGSCWVGSWEEGSAGELSQATSSPRVIL